MGLATGSFNMAELKKKSAKSAKNKAKCSKKNKTWSEEELTTFAHVLASNEERDNIYIYIYFVGNNYIQSSTVICIPLYYSLGPCAGNDGVKKELERKGIWKDSWLPLTCDTRNLRPTDVFFRRKVCYT